MKKNKSIYKIELLILILIIILFSIENSSNRSLFAIISFGILLLALLVVYGRKKDNNFYKVPAMRILISVLLFYFIVIYMLGIILGFNRTYFSLEISVWIQQFIPIFLITIITEFLRYVLIANNITNKKAICFLTVLIIFLNIGLIFNTGGLYSNFRIFLFICLSVIPIIAQDCLASYLVYTYGFLPTIVYKLIMNLHVYLLPIITNLGNYLQSVINVLIPFTIFIILRKYLKTTNDIKINRRNEKRINLSFITIPITIALIILIILVSGIFQYQLIAIASDSMVPTFYRGDAILFEKVDKSQIHIGDVIVFKKNSYILSHRVIRIKQGTDKYYFYTKGDANIDEDDVIDEENILGVVRSVLKYVGYPTVWFNELIGG